MADSLTISYQIGLCGPITSASSVVSIVAPPSVLASGGFRQRLEATLEIELADAVFSAACSSLGTPEYSGSSTTFWTKSASGVAVRLAIHAIAGAASRHNSSGRPDDLLDFLENSLATPKQSNHCVIVVVNNADEAFAAGCSVARAVPAFSMKDSNKELSDVASGTSVCVCFQFSSNDHSGKEEARFQTRLSVLRETAIRIRQAQTLVDQPCSLLNATAFVHLAQCTAQSLKKLGCPVSIKVIQGTELRDNGFGGIWGVGKASEHLPALVILSYTPAKPRISIALVGKGIVYDTGGLSIKGKTAMPGMKRDMGGAAAVFGAFQTAASTGFDGTLHAILCIAENSVGPLSTRPDDIHVMYSGLSVEINNTDAEGRLVLGDGVNYASKHLSPDIIVDMATLTGAQGIATGLKHAALYCDDESLEQSAVVAGRKCGDLCHPLPFCPEFFRKEFKSEVADMKNSVACSWNASSACAGEFIRSHLDKSYKGSWLHIDMAYPIERKERATGYGVALIMQLFHQKLAN